MSFNATFRRYVDSVGGVKNAAEDIGISESYAYQLYSRRKPISKQVAERVEIASGGAFEKSAVLWR